MERNEVIAEMNEFQERYTRAHGADADWRADFFNNFWMTLPGPMSQRNFYDSIRILDKKPLAKDISDLLRGQTWREFFDTVAAASKARNFDELEFAELIERLRAGQSVKDEMYRVIEPIYLDLRGMGYKHYPDLTI